MLRADKSLKRRPILAMEVGGAADWVTPAGDVRTLPFHLPREMPGRSGIDGFFIARLVRK